MALVLLPMETYFHALQPCIGSMTRMETYFHSSGLAPQVLVLLHKVLVMLHKFWSCSQCKTVNRRSRSTLPCCACVLLLQLLAPGVLRPRAKLTEKLEGELSRAREARSGCHCQPTRIRAVSVSPGCALLHFHMVGVAAP